MTFFLAYNSNNYAKIKYPAQHAEVARNEPDQWTIVKRVWQ